MIHNIGCVLGAVASNGRKILNQDDPVGQFAYRCVGILNRVDSEPNAEVVCDVCDAVFRVRED